MEVNSLFSGKELKKVNRNHLYLFLGSSPIVYYYFSLSRYDDPSKIQALSTFTQAAMLAWVALIVMMILEKKNRLPFNVGQGLDFSKLRLIFLGVFGTLAISSFTVGFGVSVLPLHSIPEGLVTVLFLYAPTLAKPLDTLLYQVFFVAYSEEVSKFALQCVLFRILRKNKDLAVTFGLGVPIGLWSYMHTILAFRGGSWYVHVAAATLAGILFTALIIKYGILVGIAVHAGYNWILELMRLQLIPVGDSVASTTAVMLVLAVILIILQFKVKRQKTLIR